MRLVRVVEDQRRVDLKRLERHPVGARGLGDGRGRQRPVQRRRHHDPAEHPVIAQPLRVRRRHLPLEGDPASRHVVAFAEERMPSHRALSPDSLHPVTMPLERIRRQRQTTTQLARVQPLEPQSEARLPRTRHSLDEAVPLCGGDSRSRSSRGLGLSMLVWRFPCRLGSRGFPPSRGMTAMDHQRLRIAPKLLARQRRQAPRPWQAQRLRLDAQTPGRGADSPAPPAPHPQATPAQAAVRALLRDPAR